MGSRFIFCDDDSAIQVCHITRLAIGKTGMHDRPYSVLAHIVGQLSPTRVACFYTQTSASDAIKDIIVGREYVREAAE